MYRSYRVVVLAFLSASILLTGCSLSTTAGPSTVGGASIQGAVHGGQQPVSGGKVYLLEANNAGYGTASKSLLTIGDGSDTLGTFVLTAADGRFSVSDDYTCDSGAQVYLYAVGGDSGGGPNPNVGLMTLLGQCPSSSPYNFAATVPFLYVNEVTTVAAAYSMAGFATDATHVSSSGTTLAQTGIANAFATFGNLADVATGAALAATPNGNGVVPQREINTLANILASCINSKGLTGGNTVSSDCSALFAAAKSAGSSGTTPTDTANAAINIAHNPGTVNIANLYNLQSAVASPFVPSLTSQPNDLTISLVFTGAGLDYGTNTSSALAVDGFGNIWASGVSTSVLSKFSPLGVPANASGYDMSLSTPLSLAVDANSSHVWIANVDTNSAYVFDTGTTDYDFFPTGNVPSSIAIDGSGDPWVANESDGTLTQLNPGTGEVLNMIAEETSSMPTNLAFEAGLTGNLWVTNYTGSPEHASLYSNAGAIITNLPDNSIGGLEYGNGIAVDASGNTWFTNSGKNGVSKLSSDGTSGTHFAIASGSEPTEPMGIAVDGDGNVWIAGYDTTFLDPVTNMVVKLDNSGTVLSGATGFTPVPTNDLPTAELNSIAVDGSGNVWYTTQSDDTLRELVGAAAPVVTPIAYGAANNLLGKRP